MPPKIVATSVLTCPHCGFAKPETMPEDACQWYYECTQCHRLLRPKPGDCCIYCSYGSVPCPLVQRSGDQAAAVMTDTAYPHPLRAAYWKALDTRFAQVYSPTASASARN